MEKKNRILKIKRKKQSFVQSSNGCGENDSSHPLKTRPKVFKEQPEGGGKLEDQQGIRKT